MSSATRTGGIDAEMVERVGELDAAARHPGMVAAAQLERRIGGKAGAGLVEPPLAAPDRAGQNQRLRLGAAFGKPALDQQRVERVACSWTARADFTRAVSARRRAERSAWRSRGRGRRGRFGRCGGR